MVKHILKDLCFAVLTAFVVFLSFMFGMNTVNRGIRPVQEEKEILIQLNIPPQQVFIEDNGITVDQLDLLVKKLCDCLKNNNCVTEEKTKESKNSTPTPKITETKKTTLVKTPTLIPPIISTPTPKPTILPSKPPEETNKNKCNNGWQTGSGKKDSDCKENGSKPNKDETPDPKHNPDH
jgi:hypothetical protein